MIEVQWLHDEPSLKSALQEALGSSGQLLKKFFSSKQLSRPVKARDLLTLPLDLVNNLLINPVYEGPKIKVIAEGAHYLAVHKPAGIHSHPLSYSDKNTVLNFLAEQGLYAPLLVNTSNYDRGLVYRLDLETSGVLILSKSEKLLKNVRADFAGEMKRKFYLAVVNGDFNREGLHTHYFRGTGVRGSKQKVSDEPGGDLTGGTLAAAKLAQSEGNSLLLINLKSGLRHQIRAQLAHLGFPILGDELYGGGTAARLFLHAWRYEWLETVEDPDADLFQSLFDLNRALEVGHEMLGRF